MDELRILVRALSVAGVRSALATRLVMLSFGVFAACFGTVALAAPDAVLEASAGFHPKIIYTDNPAALMAAMRSTLAAHAIAIESSSPQEIKAGYLEGPTVTDTAKETVTHSRYRFDIHVQSSASGRSLVKIFAFVENASGPPNGPVSAWRTVLSFTDARNAGNWLYEEFEHTLNGQPQAFSAQAPARNQAPSSPASDESGLGDSGDVGSAPNAATTPAPVAAPATKTRSKPPGTP